LDTGPAGGSPCEIGSGVWVGQPPTPELGERLAPHLAAGPSGLRAVVVRELVQGAERIENRVDGNNLPATRRTAERRNRLDSAGI
jgi:hypothetical protein